MPRPISAIEIYLPLDSNEGLPFEESKYVTLQEELLDRFGGITSTHRQFPLQGLWKPNGDVFQDRIVVIDFHAKTPFETLQYLERLKKRLKRKFAQLEVLITVQELLAI